MYMKQCKIVKLCRKIQNVNYRLYNIWTGHATFSSGLSPVAASQFDRWCKSSDLMSSLTLRSKCLVIYLRLYHYMVYI